MAFSPFKPVFYANGNISHAWGKALLYMEDNRVREIKPLLVSLSGFDQDNNPAESSDIRAALDDVLVKQDCWPASVSATTIFPVTAWKISGGDRLKFYDLCKRFAHSMKKTHSQANGRGIYFERLMFYGRGNLEGNQLEWIIQMHDRPPPRLPLMMYQAAVFDPERDLRDVPRQGFPCMQHVSFIPTDEGLVLNAFYATQLLVPRAYGNLLGLCHLGSFMASQMKLPLGQVNMMVGREKLGISKKELTGVVDAVRAELRE